nr:MAG TPA: hypothetical protein [Caudoviricetes sp.]
MGLRVVFIIIMSRKVDNRFHRGYCKHNSENCLLKTIMVG